MENNDEMLNIINLLDSLQEVKNYIITDMEGKIHMASAENYNENIINSCIFLWTMGMQVGNDFSIGEPINLIYHLKSRKTLIVKNSPYLMILNLKEVTNFSNFKKKLAQLL